MKPINRRNQASLHGPERRYFPLTEVQVETRAGAAEKIQGHSAVFDTLSEDLGWFREVIRPGAFANTIKRDDIVALWNHDDNCPLGATYDGRLKLQEDARGLYMEVKPTATSYARDLVTNIKGGLVRKQSFGFQVVTSDWRTEGGVEIRELIEVKLFDVSPVTFPAYAATDVQMRSLCQDAGLDFEGLAAAKVRQFRGLDLSAADRDILARASDRLPILRAAADGQASPAPKTEKPPPQAWRLNLLRRRRDLSAKSTERRQAVMDPDEDPASLAQAIDQTLDEAMAEHQQGNDDQGWQLVTAAATTVDALLEALNVPDSDEVSSAAG